MFRATKVKHYIRRMASRGYSAEAVLWNSGIDHVMLEDPNYLIDISQSQRVVANMIELTGNPYLGFELGKEVSFDDFGIMGYALMSCRTLREVTELWASLGPALVGTMLNLRPLRADDCWRVEFTEVYPLGSLLRFCTEENLTLGNWIASTVIGQPLTYKCIELAYPAPDRSEIYENIFQAPILFNAPVTATNIINPSMDYQNRRPRDDEFSRLCQEYCFQVLRQISQSRPLAFRVRQLLLDSAGDLPAVGAAADVLNMSERSLKRRLQAEGVSYQQLVNEFRNDMAKEYMRSNREISLQQISDLLGYRDSKSFSRAFKGWNGMTVSDFKRSLK
jgi:AraC-like DNA-binding protein